MSATKAAATKTATKSKANKASKLPIDASDSVVKTPKPKPEKSEKSKQEGAKFAHAVKACVKAGYVSGVEDFNSRGFQEKCGTTLNMYILESLDRIQKSECVEPADDKFPAAEYYLLADKSKASSHNKAVKKTGETRVNKKQPKKKSALGELATMAIEDDEEPTDNASASANVEPSTVDDTESKEEKPKKKNHVTQISKNGKTWLAFIVDRYVYEIYSTDFVKKATNNREEFVKLVLSKSHSFDSNLSYSVLATVDRLDAAVCNISDHEFSKVLTEKIRTMFNDDSEPRGYMVRYIVDYLLSYFKLLGYSIARMLWAKRCTTDAKVIESAMRVLDIGNDEYLVSHGLTTVDAPSNSLSNGGVYRDARKYNDALNPPISDEEKKQRNAKREASKVKREADKAAGIEPAPKASRAKKAPKTLTKKSSKKVEEEEPAYDDDDAEAEVDADDADDAEVDAEVDADDAEVEPDADDTVEIDAEVEEEQEPEPEPVKPVRRLIAAKK